MGESAAMAADTGVAVSARADRAAVLEETDTLAVSGASVVAMPGAMVAVMVTVAGAANSARADPRKRRATVTVAAGQTVSGPSKGSVRTWARAMMGTGSTRVARIRVTAMRASDMTRLIARVTGTVKASARANLGATPSITAAAAPAAPSVAAMPSHAIARRDPAAPARTNSERYLPV